MTVELAGKPRQLGFTMAAMRRCQEKGVLNLDWSDEMGMLIAVPAFVWACLGEEDRKELPFEKIELLLNPLNIKPFSEKMIELFGLSQPPQDSSGNGTPAAGDKPTGKKRTSRSSGQSGSSISV